MSNTPTQAQWRNERRIVLLLHSFLLLLIGLHLYTLTLPAAVGALPEMNEAEAHWWGFWPVRYPPVWTVWLGAGAVICVMGWQWWRIATPARWASRKTGTDEPFRLAHLSGGILTALLVGAFFAFPIVHTRWGDAYILANAVGWPDPALRLTHSWQAPLDLFLHSQLWLALHARFGWSDATPVYRLLSPVAGILYLTVLLRLSRMKALAPGWLSFGLLASLGVMQLFFGYVENYSFAAAGILAYLWIGLGVLEDKRPLWLAGVLLALLNATHPSTIVLSPSLLFLGWRQWRDGRLPAVRALVEIALPVLLAAGGTLLLMEAGGHGLAALLGDDRPGGGDGRWLVPLFATTTRWEHYTLFSWPHLRDFLNEQILIAPVVLPTLLLLWMGTIRSRRRSTEEQQPKNAGNLPGSYPCPVGAPQWMKGLYTRIKGNTDFNQIRVPFYPCIQTLFQGRQQTHFLLLAAACYWLFVWLWNPDYGGQRDWDLFSLSAIPAALLLVWMLPRVLTIPRLLWAGAWPLILFQALRTAAFVYQNRLPWEWPG